jgi:type IV pilus assembly protein PilM
MAFGNLIISKSKNVVGLDIGTNSIKLVEVEESKGGVRLKNFGITPIPKDSIVNGAIVNHDAVVSAIQQLLSNLKVKTRDAVSSVSGHPVIIKKISMPQTTDDEMEESIKFEAEQYIPFDLDEVNIDYQILAVEEGKTDHMSVMLVAAKKVMISDYVKVLTDAGLNPVILDIDVFALENAYEVNYQSDEPQAVALIDIGASTININIIKAGLSAFTRDIFLGGNQITEEIQKHFGISFDEAEALKISGDINNPEFGGKEIVKKVCDSMVAEIQKSLDFYSSTTYEQIARIYLSGGCAKIPFMKEGIEEKLNIATEVIDCMRTVSYDRNVFDPDYIKDITPLASVGVGLALRRLGD